MSPMDYEEYKKLRTQIATEYQAQLDALDMVWKRIQSLNSPSISTQSGSGGNGSHTPQIAKRIRVAIKDFKQEFTADDVQQSLVDHGFMKPDEVNRLSITNALHRLYRRKEIDVVKRGQGRNGSIYRLNPLGDLA